MEYNNKIQYNQTYNLKYDWSVTMKNKLAILLILSLSMGLFNGCNKESKNKNIESSQPAAKVEPASPSEPPKKEVKFYAPFTGEEVDEETFKNIPFMAIIENSKEARPQSGLSKADVVYETMAEGGIPRTIGLFQKNSPEKIGPIRSARTCFLDIAREYNLPFAHCGASDEAEGIINKNRLMSLNEFYYAGFYWREKDRKAPHNLYTSAGKIRAGAVSRKYNKSSKVELTFDKEYWDNETLPAANNISLNLSKYYTTDYEYKDGKYQKYMSSKPAVNKEDDEPLTFTNIVIQTTTIRKKKENILMDIALTGKGTGYVISNGRYVKMSWSKASTNSQTILKDENGKTIPLSPGNTWWNIIDKSNVVEIK